ncbi:MAG: aminotransferase class I/II-fold pyridoxal phosphate-dependent enzyme [bacterium]|nr:aminotransferase class I/II-fold pyridoxal phosphate-dependent enzyme [bacterium]
MKIETFELERLQSIWENRVDVNLTESGLHPFSLRELLDEEEVDQVLDLRLGYGWTNGEPSLRQAISGHYANTTPEEVLVTSGSAEANFLAMWTLLEPGDEIAVMLPNYMQIWGIARSLGVEARGFRLREVLAWAPDLDELRAIVSPRTRLVVVCNPNNPTGAVLSRDAMEQILEIASSVGATVYADEVYKGVELDGREGPSFRDLDPSAIVASGLSKALAHPGLRIGWLAGPADFIDAAWHRNDYTTITTSVISEHVATIILRPDRRREILDRNREMLNQNLAMLVDWTRRRPDQFHFVPPRAGGMCFLRYAANVNSTDLATRLRNEKSLLVLPGDVYGMDHYLRLGIGERGEYLKRGLELLGEAFDELQARVAG